MMSQVSPELNADVLDALAELINIGVGRAAASLSDLIGEPIELSAPRIRMCHDNASCGIDLSEPGATMTVVTQDFQGRVTGRAALALSQSSALTLGSLLSGEDIVSTEVNAELNGVLLEVGNIVLNGVLGSLSNITRDCFEYSLPTLFDDYPTLTRLLLGHRGEPVLLAADVDFTVQRRSIAGTIAIVFAGGCIDVLLDQLLEPAI